LFVGGTLSSRCENLTQKVCNLRCANPVQIFYLCCSGLFSGTGWFVTDDCRQHMSVMSEPSILSHNVIDKQPMLHNNQETEDLN
jgi:hypothetical protein